MHVLITAHELYIYYTFVEKTIHRNPLLIAMIVKCLWLEIHLTGIPLTSNTFVCYTPKLGAGPEEKKGAGGALCMPAIPAVPSGPQ